MDYVLEEDICEIFTTPDGFGPSKESLEQSGYTFLEEGIRMVPSNYVALTDEEDIKNMRRLLDQLDDNDDVVEVYHNWENEE
ncbi:transcriptional regulatory protein YebC [bioreactor metagenome]|uniref:Transcriptional regulatory protein YebC n=1 Tax=bioreactor metagenome TaxID=1076179 RepID=A0A645EL38_9ZZZZ